MMREGFLTVVLDPRDMVHGLLWDVPFAAMPALDRYEEVGSGLYAKRHLSVLTASGPRRALVYVGADAGPGTSRPGYLEGVLAAARLVPLPTRAVARLEALAGLKPSVSPSIETPSRSRGFRARP